VATPEGWNVSISGENSSSIVVEISPFENISIQFSIVIPENTSSGSYSLLVVLASQDGIVATSTVHVTVVQERSSR
jgi:uncharacterized membrane protein